MRRVARQGARVLVAGLALAGCGYRFTPKGAALPGGVKSVCVPVLLNRTAEPALETLFTQALREQLQRAGTLGDGLCEARIEGEILGVGSGQTIVTQPSTPTGVSRVASYRGSVTAILRLRKGDAVLSEAVVSGSEDFLPGSDVLESERNRQAALRRLTTTLMQEGYDRLASDW